MDIGKIEEVVEITPLFVPKRQPVRIEPDTRRTEIPEEVPEVEREKVLVPASR